MPIIVIITLIVLIQLYVVLLSKNAPFIDEPIGKRQFDLIKAYMDAESALFYVDQSAKYALQQAVYDTAQKGGVSEDAISDNKCGKIYGYAVWHELEKDDTGNYIKNSCINEEKVKKSLVALFNENLNQYLLSHPSRLPTDNYNYEIKGSLEITGKAIAPLKFDILKEEKKS